MWVASWTPALLLAHIQNAYGNSLYLAQKCRNFACHQSDRPLMDYNAESGQCLCAEHPCWDDNGQMHHCLSKEYPFLSFHFTETLELTCTCSSFPHYGSVYIARDICAGHRCEKPDHPVLDWDEAQQDCVCRSHPCWNDGGEKHECTKKDYPILRYREEQDDQDQIRSVCECFKTLDKDELPQLGSIDTSSASKRKLSHEEDDADEYVSPDWDDDEF